LAKDDPLAMPDRAFSVLQLLKSANPPTLFDTERTAQSDDADALPLESGRALAVTVLQSAIGITSARPLDDDVFDSLPVDPQWETTIANFHDEMSFMLL
jgi:hypothetical protein